MCATFSWYRALSTKCAPIMTEYTDYPDGSTEREMEMEAAAESNAPPQYLRQVRRFDRQ